jgi:hypothetical protein
VTPVMKLRIPANPSNEIQGRECEIHQSAGIEPAKYLTRQRDVGAACPSEHA